MDLGIPGIVLANQELLKKSWQIHDAFPKFPKFRNSPAGGVLKRSCQKICSEFTEEHSCRSAISIKLQSDFTEIALRRGCYPANLLRIFRTPFPRNTSGWLFLHSVNVILENRKRFSGFSQINWLVPIWWET